MPAARPVGLLLALLLSAGCASPGEGEDAEESGQASSAATCRPFLLDVSAGGRGVAFERMCTSTGAAEWALVYRTVLDGTRVDARYVAQGPRKAELEKTIQRMAAEGVTAETTRFFDETLEPALAALVKTEGEAEKTAARLRVRGLIEEHLLSLGGT